MHLNVILNSSQNDQHLFVWKYLCKPSSSLSSSSSSSSSPSYSSSNLTEAQIDPNPFHSLMSAIGLRRKLCKRNSEQVIDSYYSPNKHQKSQLKSVCGILFTEYPGFCFVLFKGSCINQQRFPWPWSSSFQSCLVCKVEWNWKNIFFFLKTPKVNGRL